MFPIIHRVPVRSCLLGASKDENELSLQQSRDGAQGPQALPNFGRSVDDRLDEPDRDTNLKLFFFFDIL
jgi:hypothetical protein